LHRSTLSFNLALSHRILGPRYLVQLPLIGQETLGAADPTMLCSLVVVS